MRPGVLSAIRMLTKEAIESMWKVVLGRTLLHLNVQTALEEEAQAQEAANGQPQQRHPRTEEGVRLPWRHARRCWPKGREEGGRQQRSWLLCNEQC